MKGAGLLFPIFAALFSACGSLQTTPTAIPMSTMTFTPPFSKPTVPESTLEVETIEAIPTFTPLASPCSTLAPDELNDFINNSITIEDNGKNFVAHITSRFWIYLDDRIYPLQDLMNSIPNGLLGYISNGSLRGPQCYPIMFEAVHEGKGPLKIKDFQLSIIVDDSLLMPTLPLD